MGIIVGVVVTLLLVGLLVACFKLLLNVAKYALGAAIGLYLSPALLLGYVTYKVSRWARVSWLAQPFSILVATSALIVSLSLSDFAWTCAFTLSVLLAIGGTINRARAARTLRPLGWGAAARQILFGLDLPSHFALWLVPTALVFRVGSSSLDPNLHAFGAWGFWLAASAAQAYASFQFIDIRKTVRSLERRVENYKGEQVRSVLAECREATTLLEDEVDQLFPLHIASHVLDGKLVEIDVAGHRRLYATSWYRSQLALLRCVLAQRPRFADDELGRLTATYLGLELKAGLELLTLQESVGQRYQFADGAFFVSFSGEYAVETCASCGMGRHVPHQDDSHGEWFCSDICRATEKTCLDIHRQAPESFISDSVSIGMSLVASSDSWIRNHKVFATGSQGHGPGAEHGNTYVDRLRGTFAKAIGADNAKNGADRAIGDIKIQTKYCKTAGKSVGQAFGNDGIYRYMNGDKPMQLEVPRDQYEKAVAVMRKKITAGKVPNITDPDQAENIIRKGHLTYENAVNLTKFGTWESLSYDAAEGAVAGIGSATIGFCITSGLVFFRTRDTEIALQAAALQAGKAGLTTAAVHIGTQQLHRIEFVQSALSHIDMTSLSPSVQEVLMAGFGVSKVNQLNLALRGTVVTAVVSVAVTSVPDVYRLVRREVTVAKLQRTVVTAGGMVAGSVVGGFVGGAVGGYVGGPYGAWAGKFVGGAVGGWAGTAVVDYFFAEQKEREREAANERFRAHLEHLAISFALSEEELRCVIRNFLKVSSEDIHQKVLAGKHDGRPYLNSLLKPIVIGVVKQRDYIASQLSAELPLLEAA